MILVGLRHRKKKKTSCVLVQIMLSQGQQPQFHLTACYRCTFPSFPLWPVVCFSPLKLENHCAREQMSTWRREEAHVVLNSRVYWRLPRSALVHTSAIDYTVLSLFLSPHSSQLLEKMALSANVVLCHFLWGLRLQSRSTLCLYFWGENYYYYFCYLSCFSCMHSCSVSSFC